MQLLLSPFEFLWQLSILENALLRLSEAGTEDVIIVVGHFGAPWDAGAQQSQLLLGLQSWYHDHRRQVVYPTVTARAA